MNTIFKIFLATSCSGAVLIAALLLGKRLWKDRLSRQWQYYIWLVVIFRLLFPFGPELGLMGKAYQAASQAIAQKTLPPQQEQPVDPVETVLPSVSGGEQGGENAGRPAENLTDEYLLQNSISALANWLWLVWLAVVLALLIRKITAYQSFLRYVSAGSLPVSDLELLNRLTLAAEQAGIKRPVELSVHPMLSSPMLVGLFRPCIVLPGTDISEGDFQYIVLHELTHYKRRDVLYKWLVQAAICLHWFNPLVWLMGREITSACEFSCDEAVLENLGDNDPREYGQTLLDAMAAVGKYREAFGAAPLSENKELLKERLNAIMNFRKKSGAVWFLTGVLTAVLLLGAAFAGTSPAVVAADAGPSAGNDPAPSQSALPSPAPAEASETPSPAQAESPEPAPVQSGIPDSAPTQSAVPDLAPVQSAAPAPQPAPSPDTNQYSAQAEQYYTSGSLPLFQITFSHLSQTEQSAWLERLYSDGAIAFFSTLTNQLSEATLEDWLNRAIADGRWNFQSMLSDALGKRDEFDGRLDAQEKAWAEAQMAEYRAVGVTKEGKNYYYQGQLVNIFLDIRPNKSFYTLDMNPAGTVNVKILRSSDGQITGAAYMTEAEVAELLSDD